MEATALEIKKLGEDLALNIKTLEGQIKSNGEVSQETQSQVKGLLDKIEEINKKSAEQAREIEEMAIKLNRPDQNNPSEEAFAVKAMKQVAQSKGLSADAGQDAWKSYVEQQLSNSRAGLGFSLPYGVSELSTKAVGTITNANITNGPVTRDLAPGITTVPLRKQHIRNFISQRPLNGAQYEYVRANTPTGEGGANYQATEGATKATTDYDFTLETEKPHVIAVTATISKQAVQDFPELLNFVSTDMVNGNRGIYYKEDAELLYGAGGGSALNGIATQATAYLAAAGTNAYDYILKAIFAQMDGDYDVNSILLRPIDYAALLQLKDDQNAYTYPMLYVPNQNQPMVLAGVPIYMNTAISTGTAIVGDWSSANAEMLIRNGISVELSYENSDNFVKNLVTVRVEERVGLAVKMATAFRTIDFDTFAA